MWRTAFCVKCNKERPLRRLANRRGHVCAWCGDRVLLENIKGAKATRSEHTGAVFPSKEEAKREPYLLAAERSGAIKDLKASAWKGERRTPAYDLVVYSNSAVEQLAAAAKALVEAITAYRDHPAARPPTESLLGAKLANAAFQVGAATGLLMRSTHKITTYRPDYVYTIVKGDVLVVEDVKVYEQQHFREKRRLMMACHNIDVQVIRGSGRNLYGRMR